MTDVSEERFLQVASQVMSDTAPLAMNIQIQDAWFVVTTLQLATRHPSISDAQKARFHETADKFQAAIVERHPEAKPLLDMGWNEMFDHDDRDPSADVNAPISQPTLKAVNNCWTIYLDDVRPDRGEPAFAQIGRPQDWGHPRWMHRVYTLEAQGYRNTVHCWVDVQMPDHKHLELFAPLIAQIMLPGWPENKSGRDYLTEDDFWSKEWGERPPYLEDDEYSF